MAMDEYRPHGYVYQFGMHHFVTTTFFLFIHLRRCQSICVATVVSFPLFGSVLCYVVRDKCTLLTATGEKLNHPFLRDTLYIVAVSGRQNADDNL